MARPRTKGPAITLRLHLDADRHVREAADKAGLPVGEFLARRFEASVNGKAKP